MGDCHSAETDSASLAQVIDELTSENLNLTLAMVYACLEIASEGMALKLMNVHRLMHRYTQTVSAQRSLVIRHESRLSHEESLNFEESLQRQLVQLQTSNTVLKKALKQIKPGRTQTHKESVQVYLSHAPVHLIQEFERIQRIYRKHYKSLDEAIKLVTRGAGLSQDETKLVLEISRQTTYPYTNKENKITYEAPYFSRRLSANLRKSKL